MTIRTADLCDTNLSELSICRIPFQSYGGIRCFSGPIATVEVFADNLLILEAIDSVPSGTVLVVEGGANLRCALVGGNVIGRAEARGLAGVVVHGAVRDVAELRECKIGVLALGSVPVPPSKKGGGRRDTSLHFGEAEFVPNHYLYADEDGVVVAPRPLASE